MSFFKVLDNNEKTVYNNNSNYYCFAEDTWEKKKHSKKRDAILACVRSTNIHPTAEWIYQMLKSDYPDLSLGTVYRNLTEFKKEGQIISVGVFDGQEHFDGNTLFHAHFVCEKCGAVIDVENEFVPLSEVQALSEKVDCGLVKSSTVQFNGICQSCLEKGKK